MYQRRAFGASFSSDRTESVATEFPNLDAGNVAVKCIQVFGGFKVCGPVLQGFARPVTDFSRSATADEVFGNVVLCLAQNGMA